MLFVRTITCIIKQQHGGVCDVIDNDITYATIPTYYSCCYSYYYFYYS